MNVYVYLLKPHVAALPHVVCVTNLLPRTRPTCYFPHNSLLKLHECDISLRKLSVSLKPARDDEPILN